MDVESRPVNVSQPPNGGLRYSGDLYPQTKTATVHSGMVYRITPAGANPTINSLNSGNGHIDFGTVYYECTFTVTGIGTGNPQLVDTKISQTFNMPEQ